MIERKSPWKYQFSRDRWSQAMLSSVSTWIGDFCSSVVWLLLLTLKIGFIWLAVLYTVVGTELAIGQRRLWEHGTCGLTSPSTSDIRKISSWLGDPGRSSFATFVGQQVEKKKNSLKNLASVVIVVVCSITTKESKFILDGTDRKRDSFFVNYPSYFFSHPVLLELICYHTTANRLKCEDNTNGWLKNIRTGNFAAERKMRLLTTYVVYLFFWNAMSAVGMHV